MSVTLFPVVPARRPRPTPPHTAAKTRQLCSLGATSRELYSAAVRRNARRQRGEAMSARIYLRLLLTLLLTMASRGVAQTSVSVKSGGVTAIHAGRLIDVRSGNVAQNVYVVIEKDRITRIADSLPTGAVEIDLSRYTVVPGLIDAHSHILGNPKDQSS